MADSEELTTEVTEKKGSKLPLVIIVVVAIFIIGGVVFAMNLTKTDAPKQELDPDEFVYYPFEEMVVNVKKSNHRLNIVTTICVKVTNEKVKAQIEKHKPKFRDRMLTILGSKELKDLDNIGKERIRSEIKQAFNSSPELTEGEVLDVYYNDFTVGQ